MSQIWVQHFETNSPYELNLTSSTKKIATFAYEEVKEKVKENSNTNQKEMITFDDIVLVFAKARNEIVKFKSENHDLNIDMMKVSHSSYSTHQTGRSETNFVMDNGKRIDESRKTFDEDDGDDEDNNNNNNNNNNNSNDNDDDDDDNEKKKKEMNQKTEDRTLSDSSVVLVIDTCRSESVVVVC
eukprot:Pgem_evm1s60